MAAKSVWGIDIGQVALKALRLSVNDNGQPIILAFEVIEHSKILSQPDVDEETADGLVREALEKFVQRQDVLKSEVVLGIPGHKTFARFTKLPPVEPAQVPSIVEFEAGQQIPFPIEDVVWDYQAFQEPGAPDIEVGIFAVKREIVDKQLTFCKAVNLSPTIIQMNPMAVYNFVQHDGQLAPDGATVIIDVGAENTDLIIGDGERVWQRTWPSGGNAFTTALVNSFKLSFSKAESLKRTSEQSKYGRQVFQAMKPAFSDLLTEINRSVGFYTSLHRESQIKKYLLVGNTFKFPGLAQYLKQSLSNEVVKVEGFSRIEGGGMAATPAFVQNATGLATAYGLALQGLGLTKVNANLLPSEQARELMWRRKTFWFISSAACLAASAAVLFASLKINEGKFAGFENRRQETQDIIARAEADRAKFDQVREAGQEEEQFIQRILALQTPEVKALVPKIYDLAVRALPEHPALVATSTAEYVAALKKEKRTERRIIVLDRFDLRYVPDFNQEAGVPAAPLAADGSLPPPRPGFEMTLIGQTPYEDANGLLATVYIARLRDLGNRPELPFEVDTADASVIKWIKKVKETPDDSLVPESARNAPLDVGVGAAPGAPAAPTEREEIDALTGEKASDDSRFEMRMRIYIKPPPAPPTAGAAPA